MQRYFAAIHQGKAKLLPSDIFHITNVMRMRPLDKVEIAADGHIYLGEVVSLSPFEVRIISSIIEDHELPNKVTLLYALAKGDKTDLVIQKATELGVSEIIGLVTERTIVRLDDQDKAKKLERYTKIIKEAGEQSQRSILPKMDRIIDYKQIGACHFDYQFIAYEREAGRTDAFYEILRNIPSGASIGIIVGAEGGFSENEVKIANQNGYVNVGLGKRILRSETAAIYALSVIAFILER